jgi:hypothetical protein
MTVIEETKEVKKLAKPKRFQCISRTSETVYLGGSTLGDQRTVYPGSTIVIETPEEEKYLLLTKKFVEKKDGEPSIVTQVLEKVEKPINKKKFMS